MELVEQDYIITTRPVIPPYSHQSTLSTSIPHVILRPFHINDLDSLHELRSQIEVMRWTSAGKVDADINKTRTWMSRFMDVPNGGNTRPNPQLESQLKREGSSDGSPVFNFIIVHKDNITDSDELISSKEKVIGAGGCHVMHPKPECGYMIRQEYWGQGIATAVLKAILEAYWNLDRKVVKISKPIPGQDADQLVPIEIKKLDESATTAREVLAAEIDVTNIGSQRVLQKCGFQHEYDETVYENGNEFVLAHYVLPRPHSVSSL